MTCRKEGDLEVAEPSVESLAFEDVASGAPVEEQKFDPRARIEISDWELLDFAIQVVRNELEQEGYHIEDWTSEPGPGAHIPTQGSHTYAHRRRHRPLSCYRSDLDRDRLMSVAETTLIEGGRLAKASVVLAHSDGPSCRSIVVHLQQLDIERPKSSIPPRFLWIDR